MAKPAAYTERQVEELLLAPSARDRAERWRTLASLGRREPGEDEFELELATCASVASRSWRDSYVEVAPRACVLLSASLELAAGLDVRERRVSMLAAVAAARTEGLGSPASLAGFPWSHSLSPEATVEDLDKAVAEHALPRFHGRLVPFLNEETRRKYAHRYLYGRSALDLAGGGWRHVLSGRLLRLSDTLRWRRSEEVAYPLSHYFVYGPQDFAQAELLEHWLESADARLGGDNRNRKGALPAEAVEALEAAMREGSNANVLARVRQAWEDGYSVEAVLDGLLLMAGAQLASGGGREEALATAVLYLDACFAATPWMQRTDGMVQALMAALLLRGLVAGTGFRLPAGDSGGSLRELAAAFGRHDRSEAIRLGRSLAASDPKGTALGMAREATLRDKSADDMLAMAAVAPLVCRFERSPSPRRDELLGAAAALLARPASWHEAEAGGVAVRD